MMKGPDGSLRPEPGELQRRLTKIEELNQAVDGQMGGCLGGMADGGWWFFFFENGKSGPFLKKRPLFFLAVFSGKLAV